MTHINNNNLENLPVSFMSFLVSRPCWMRENFHQASAAQMAESFHQASPERLATAALKRHEETVKHSGECKRRFGAFDLNCPRCMELSKGAARRSGWSGKYSGAQYERLRAEEIRRHDCKASQCGAVCTFGEW